MPAAVAAPVSELPELPDTFRHTRPAPELCYQGAEAILYRTVFPVAYPAIVGQDAAQESQTESLPSYPAFLKHRPPKLYRHPILDAKLTRHRILAEARVLVKLRRETVPVPAIYALDWEAGWMLGEWIDGEVVRAALDREVPLWLASEDDKDFAVSDGRSRGQALRNLMSRIGKAVGLMHEAGVVHGDLTTSNLMLRHLSNGDAAGSFNHGQPGTLTGDIILIDFGLSSQSNHDEDRAVDLYVLERAFGSTHPRTEALFEEVLSAYRKSYKGANVTLKRLEEVRMRGRKKIAIG